ncbi:unnamed protein product, partial [Arabidopsis halleri]
MASASELAISSAGDPDAAMTDISEQGRPPGDPPDVPGLWVQKVTGAKKVVPTTSVASAGGAEVVSGSQPENDGFTVVRRAGRRPAKPDARVVVTAQESESDLGRNLQEISENIMVSNRFGGLEEDLVSMEMREVTILSGGDKENINQDHENISKTGKSVEQGREGTEASQMIKGLSGSRGSSLPKKALGLKQNGPVGSKPKYKNVNRPSRGLVFGPTREELVLSASGKRLRVENRAVGRLGGVFVRED